MQGIRHFYKSVFFGFEIFGVAGGKLAIRITESMSRTIMRRPIPPGFFPDFRVRRPFARSLAFG
jgi:hypothetical protein